MRYTVTPIGGAKRSLRQVVADIVNYLAPKNAPTALKQQAPNGPSRYYADRGDEPGRWLGSGTDDLDLVGEVDSEDFALVLAGRDPRTGARLITAQGSAGRRPHLGVGTHTRWDAARNAIYDEHDAAAVLDLDATEVAKILDAGTENAVARLVQALGPAGTSATGAGSQSPTTGIIGDLPGGSYLVPVIDAQGRRWITEAEMARYEEARAVGITPDDIAATGAPDDVLTIAGAARLVGVTPRHLRGLALYYEQNQTFIDQLVATGQQPRQDYLVAQRNSRGWWLVKRSDLVDYVHRREPPAVRVGFDLTLTTEKSLSVLALLSDPATGAKLLGAIQDANDRGLRWLEDHAATARVKGETVAIDGWVVASFQHLTSRALDPFAHWHNVVPNTVKTTDGSRRALNAHGLYDHAQAASALATAQARWRITRDLGARWRPGRTRGWEIAGVADEVLTEFSQRRNEVDDALRELEEAIGRSARPDEVEQIVLRTRPPKQDADVDELRARWWQRANALGFHHHDLAACLGHSTRPAEPDPEWINARLAAPDGICCNLSVFDYGDLLTKLCDLPIPQPNGADSQPLLVPAERLEQLAYGFLDSTHVVPVTTGDNPTWTTREILAVQERVADRFASGLGQGAAVVTRAALDGVLADHLHLTGEQRRLVRQFCTSGHTIQCAVGYPGAGKTTSMAAARDAWETAGVRVVGAAVKGEAARLLADATGMPTETLAWWLAHQDPQAVPLDARTVLIVDEASTISDRDLDRLSWLCEQTGATLRLIGDPGQHGAVQAGGMFRVLCEHHPAETPRLIQTHRVRDPHDRAAADALRTGNIDQALDHLEHAGHLHIVNDELDFYRQALSRWWHARQAGLDHPMVDGRNIVRQRLNRLAHQLLKATGEIGHFEITAAGDRCFSVGDEVIARAPARHLHPAGQPNRYVRNGAVGTIARLRRGHQPADDTITVDFAGIGTITLPRSYFDEHQPATGRVDVGLDHGYAVTSYAVQGSTRKVSTSRLDERSTRAELLVDITRGEIANHVYLTHTTSDLDDEQLPRIPPPPVDQTVIAKLRRSKGEVTAWELIHGEEASSLDERGALDAVGF